MSTSKYTVKLTGTVELTPAQVSELEKLGTLTGAKLELTEHIPEPRRLPKGTKKRFDDLGLVFEMSGRKLHPSKAYAAAFVDQILKFLDKKENDRAAFEAHHALRPLSPKLAKRAKKLLGDTFEGEPIDTTTPHDRVWLAKIERECQRIIDEQLISIADRREVQDERGPGSVGLRRGH